MSNNYMEPGERLLRKLNFFDERQKPSCNRGTGNIKDWIEYLGWRNDGMSRIILGYNKGTSIAKKDI